MNYTKQSSESMHSNGKPASRQAVVASIGVTSLLVAAAFLAHGSPKPRPQAAFSSGNPRVDKLISQMTLEEKISLLHGTGEPDAQKVGAVGYWGGLKRLGIPYMRFADGPQGLSTTWFQSTGMISGTGLAATFSLEDARGNGEIIGRDARSLGIDAVLEPTVNVARDPGGRAGGGGGEDPLLTGKIFAAEIQGIQSQHELAQAKTFVSGQDVEIAP